MAARLLLFFLLVVLESARAEDPQPSFVITSFSSRKEKGLRSDRFGKPHFTVQFKVRDTSVFELERAAVYLFDDNNRLVHTLTDIDPGPFFFETGTPRKGMAPRYPNLIRSVEGLEPGITYTLVFRHLLGLPGADEVRTSAAEVPWKSAVAVIGADGRYVYKVLPGWKRVEELEFRERDKGVEVR